MSCAIALAATGVLALSSAMTWASTEVGGGGVSYTLLEIPAAPVLFGLALATIVVGIVIAWLGRPVGFWLAGLVAACLALVTGLFLILSELIASLVLGGELPIGSDAFALGAGIGPGPPVGLMAALTISACTLQPVRDSVAVAVTRLRGRGAVELLALGALAVALLLTVLLREETWLRAEAFGASVEMAGATLPWVGWLSVLAGWILFAGLLAICLERLQLGALLAALAGWLLTFVAALTIAGPDALRATPASDTAATGAVWAVFALGYCVAAAAATLLWTRGEGR